jgi:hypothetical protein
MTAQGKINNKQQKKKDQFWVLTLKQEFLKKYLFSLQTVFAVEKHRD